MNINLPKIIEVDKAGQPITPSILLAYKDGIHINTINNVKEIRVSNHMVDADEICFDVYKELDGVACNVWDMLKNFMLVHVPRFEKWYQISISIDEDNNSIKHVDAIQAQQAELSQLMLNEIEIDTEDDIARDDYTWQDTGTLFYDSERPERSLLNRILKDKAPHYSIYHVDSSLCKVSRQFSFDGTSILDALQEIAEEVNCLFVFGEHHGHDGKMHRTISAYDMSVICNTCGERDVVDDVCPKCGSTDLYPGYGEFANTFVSAENFTDSINFTTNTDQIKNCFSLSGGDDDMTAAIRNCNPSGSQYIWYFSDEMYASMSSALRDKLSEYLELSKHFEIDNVYEVDATAYNSLVEKYHVYDEDIPTIPTEGIQGYSSLIEAEYNVMDFDGYLYSSLMPDADAAEDTTAEEQAQNLLDLNNQTIGVQKVSGMSKYTADSNIITYAKVFVDTSRYRIEVASSTFTAGNTTATWAGTFQLTNYLDDEDVATSSTITVTFENNNTAYYRQLVQKALAKADTEKVGIVALFDMEIADFKNAIKHYSYLGLENLNTIAGTCLGILMPDNTVTEAKSLYDKYLQLQRAVESEFNLRGQELEIVNSLLKKITEIRLETQNQMVLQEFLGEELWVEFSSFRRDDTYGNSNYISDGLTNTQIIEKAREYYNAARRELVKAATAQHTISCNLYDLLLLIPEQTSLLEKFDTGNWIQVRVDDHVYRLRITDYEVDYEDLSTINVTFADFTDKQDIASETARILKNAQSMSTSFGAVAKQAEKGENVSNKIRRYEQEGYSLTAQKIVNNATEQNMVIDENGLLARHYDEITDSYNDNQVRIINDGIYYTNDGWETVFSGLGRFYYTDPETGATIEDYGVIAKTIVGQLILGEKLKIYTENGHVKIDAGGLTITSDATTPLLNTSLFTIQRQNENGTITKMLSVDSSGHVVIDGSVQIGNTETPVSLDDVLDGLDDIQDQVDGKIETWTQDSNPASAWTTTDLQSAHNGDLWLYTGLTNLTVGSTTIKPQGVYQYNGTNNTWSAYSNASNNLFDVVDGKSTVYYGTTSGTYSGVEVNDYLVDSTDGSTYRWSDQAWIKVTDYQSAIDDLQDELESQIDAKIETWVQDSDPATAWTTSDARLYHNGDLWLYTGTTDLTVGSVTIKPQGVYQYNGTSNTWAAYSSTSSNLFDMIDGKSTIYYGTPSGSYSGVEVGDYLVDSTDGCTYRRTSSGWAKVTDYATPVAEAAGTATNYLTEVSNGVFVHAEGIPSDPTASTAAGVHITDEVDIIRNGQVVAQFGEVARVGRQKAGHVDIESSGFTIYGYDNYELFKITESNIWTPSVSDLSNKVTYTCTASDVGRTDSISIPLPESLANVHYLKVLYNNDILDEYLIDEEESSGGEKYYYLSVSPDDVNNGNGFADGDVIAAGIMIGIGFIFGSVADDTIAPFGFSHGILNTVTGTYAFASGNRCIASGNNSHAEGIPVPGDNNELVYVTASGLASHAEGTGTTASGEASHAEGTATVASDMFAHAEGAGSIASGYVSHAEGSHSIASGQGSHAEGANTEATATASHAQNYYTKAGYECQTAIGRYNNNLSNSAFEIGKGTSEASRSNALTVNWNGNTTIAGTLTQSSDKRLKEHIDYLDEDAVEFVRRLKPAHYIKDNEHHVGFYAQDVEEADQWNCMVGEMNDYKTLGYTELIAPLVKYCQSLEARIEQLEEKLKEG